MTIKELAWLNRNRGPNPLTKGQWEQELKQNNSLRHYFEDAQHSGEIWNWIPPVREDNTIPDDACCQEASTLSRARYMPCGAPAVAIVYHDKDQRGYYMCGPCADHNVRNRGGQLVARKEGA